MASVKKLMKSAEENVCQAWLRPITGCFPSLSSLLNEITIGRGEGLVDCVASLGDGRHVVSLCSGDIRIYDIETSESVLTLGTGKDIFVVAVATPNKDSYLVFSGGRGVRVTRIEKDVNGKLQKLDNKILDSREVSNMAVSRDGSRIVAVFPETNKVSVWTQNDDERQICHKTSSSFPYEKKVSHLTMSPDGDVLVSAQGKKEVVFDCIRSRKEGNYDCHAIARTAPIEDDSISSIAFSKDAQSLVVGTRLGAVEVWSVSTRTCTKRKILGESVECLEVVQTVSPGDNPENVRNLLLVGVSNSLKLFDLQEMKRLGKYQLSSRPHSICTLMNSKSKQLVIAGCSDASVSIVDVEDVIQTVAPDSWDRQGTGSPVTAVAIAPKRGIILSGHENGTFRSWKLDSGRRDHTFASESQERVTCIGVSDDEETAASGGVDGSVVVWNIASTRGFVLEAQSGSIVYVNVASDNSTIVTMTSRGVVQVWEGRARGPTFEFLFDKLCEARRYFSRFLPDSAVHFQWETLFSHLSTAEETDSAPSRHGNAVYKSTNTWMISAHGRTLRCSLKLADGASGSGAEKVIDIHRRIDDIVLCPRPYANNSENVIIALVLEGQASPAILHLVSPNRKNETV